MKYIKSIYIGLVGMLMAACTDELPTQTMVMVKAVWFFQK